MNKNIIFICILLVLILVSYLFNINVSSDYKKQIKQLRKVNDSLTSKVDYYEKLSDRIQGEIDSIQIIYVAKDSILKKQEYNIAILKWEIQKLKNKKNEPTDIVNADSSTIERYRTKYFRFMQK
jgi:peptidoglycan hydrolase CwlO-like protein